VTIVLRFIFTYSTVTGRKCEINIIVIVIVIVKKNGLLDNKYERFYGPGKECAQQL